MRGKDDAGQVLFELVGGQVGEKDAAHAGAVGGQAAADVEIDGHDTVDGGARDVNDVVAVECGYGERFAEGGGHALEDGLGGAREGVGGGVGVGEGQHAGAKRIARTVFGSGESKFGEGIETASDGGAGEASAYAELRDGHLGVLLGECLDDDESSGEGGHEVGIAGEGVERGGRGGLWGRNDRGRGGRNGGRNGGSERVARSEAQEGPFPSRLWRISGGDSRTISTINAQTGLSQDGGCSCDEGVSYEKISKPVLKPGTSKKQRSSKGERSV